MRKFFLLFGIALSLFLVLSQQEDRTLLRQGFGVPADKTQIDRTQGNVLSINAVLEVEGSRRYEISLPQGSTAYQLMLAAQEQYGFRFRGKEFPGIGFFIQEINGLEQSPRAGRYWIYEVNGEEAIVGVSNYIIQPYDVITWKYENEE